MLEIKSRHLTWVGHVRFWGPTVYLQYFFPQLTYMIYIHIFYVSNRFMYKKNIGTLKVLVRLYTLEISKHYHIFARIGTRKKYNKRSYIFYTIDEKNWAANQFFKSKGGKRYFSSSIIFLKKSGLSWPNE